MFIFCSFVFLFVEGWASLSEDTIYLTWQRDPATTMTIQWISHTEEKQSNIVYSPLKEEGKWNSVGGETLPFPQAPQYLIHRVEIRNLRPDTEYLFKVLSYPKEYRFLTAPTRLDKEVRFVVGGDMYHDSLNLLVKTNQEAALTAPLFALLGGDIAYSVRSRLFGFQQINRWIDWVKAWHTYMVTPEGNSIPVISAIGNHDLNGGFDQTPTQAAIFSTLFPMPGKQVYNVLDFDSYLSIFILDSGHANPIGGQQTKWLESALQSRQAVGHKIVAYHVPAYPSVRDHKDKYSAAIRTSWVPLFEQGGIQTAFEHHDHAYKRTYPLLNGKINPKGVVYLGDGAWGVEKPRKFNWKHPQFASLASSRHFIAVTLTSKEQSIRSINDQGQLIDEYRQPVDRRYAASQETLQESLPVPKN